RVYSGAEDLVFGTVHSGRSGEIVDIEHIVGLFINTLPLRVNFDQYTTFANLLVQIHEQSLQSGDYSYSPLYEIQQRSQCKRGLFDHIVVFENYPLIDGLQQAAYMDRIGLHVQDVNMVEETHYDFTLIAVPGRSMEIKLRYN